MEMLKWFLIILVAILALNCLMRTRGTGVKNGKPWKVYGSMDCGWTRKQIEELKNNGVHYEFLDCSGERCREGMPENILPDGSRRVGFTKAG